MRVMRHILFVKQATVTFYKYDFYDSKNKVYFIRSWRYNFGRDGWAYITKHASCLWRFRQTWWHFVCIFLEIARCILRLTVAVTYVNKLVVIFLYMFLAKDKYILPTYFLILFVVSFFIFEVSLQNIYKNYWRTFFFI